jgi:hypothetical protein
MSRLSILFLSCCARPVSTDDVADHDRVIVCEFGAVSSG